MELLQGSPSVLGRNDSRGVILSWDGTTPGESFYPGMERHQGSHSVLEGMTPEESFCLGMERFLESPFLLGWNDSMGVFPSQDRRTPVESFCPGIERH